MCKAPCSFMNMLFRTTSFVLSPTCNDAKSDRCLAESLSFEDDTDSTGAHLNNHARLILCFVSARGQKVAGACR